MRSVSPSSPLLRRKPPWDTSSASRSSAVVPRGPHVVDEFTTSLDVAARYRFVIDSFHVEETRSPQTDTLSLYAAAIKGLYLGDAKNGDTLKVGRTVIFSADIQPSDEMQTAVGFILTNHGSIHSQKDAEQFAAGINSITSDLVWGLLNLIGTAGDDPSGNDHWDMGLSWSAFFIFEWTLLAHLWTLDCNGDVAVVVPAVTGRELAEATRSSDVWTNSETSHGTDSEQGCGPNSIYRTTYSFHRIAVPKTSPPCRRRWRPRTRWTSSRPSPESRPAARFHFPAPTPRSRRSTTDWRSTLRLFPFDGVSWVVAALTSALSTWRPPQRTRTWSSLCR